jgi:AAHS family benzoate transporter-like MFS transporter
VSSPALTSATSRMTVVAICFAAIVFDGYDLIVYGSSVPALLDYEPWNLTPGQVGAIGSYALMGMFFGAISSGALSDRFGRRRLFIGCLAWYSVAMIFVATAPSAELLGMYRFIAGLGFGGIAPVAVALVVEVARPHERNRLNAVMLAGLPVGGVLAAVAAITLLDDLGFRGLWAFGSVALLTVVPLAWKFIPETAGAMPRGPQRTRVRDLLGSGQVTAIVLFSIANFMGFLLVFGLNVWLPELMRRAGYSLGSALTFQLLLNAGAIAGGYLGSAVADRCGSRRVATAAFALAAIAIAVMATTPPAAAMVLVTIAAGAGSIGTQIVVFGFVATYYPAEVRATALGITTGIGRLGAVCGPLVGGWLLGVGLAFGWAFAFFGLMAAIGSVASLLVPKSPINAPDGADSSTRAAFADEPSVILSR